jgi:N-acetylneuraminate synthase
MTRIKLGSHWIGVGEPTYFIADISANHDGDLDRARMLIRLAAEAGADAAKFQNFQAARIVSRFGFENLGSKLSHQASWKKSVFQVYQEASIPWDWTPILKRECDEAGIDYCSTPYDLDAVDMLDPFVPWFKVGSGDITWPEMLRKIASTGKPVVLATGAATIGDVQRAVHIIRAINREIVLLQCNTNYTGSLENFRHIHLNVLKSFQAMFPEVVLGLSDHTPGHSTVLGAVALGARAVEKHFTDDTGREGPDHPFSMDPTTWKQMVDRTRELELALGNSDKRISENETQTVVAQRRCLRAARELASGTVLTRDLIDVLRPAPEGAIPPTELDHVIGLSLCQDVKAGEHLSWTMMRSWNPA